MSFYNKRKRNWLMEAISDFLDNLSEKELYWWNNNLNHSVSKHCSIKSDTLMHHNDKKFEQRWFQGWWFNNTNNVVPKIYHLCVMYSNFHFWHPNKDWLIVVYYHWIIKENSSLSIFIPRKWQHCCAHIFFPSTVSLLLQKMFLIGEHINLALFFNCFRLLQKIEYKES